MLLVDPNDPAGRYFGASKGKGRADFHERYGLSKPPITSRDPTNIRVTHGVSKDYIFY